MPKKALTTSQAAEICGVHHRTISRWVRNGYLKAFKTPGGHLRILRNDLHAFMSSRKLRGFDHIPDLHRVLVVDDEEAFRDSAVRFLEKIQSIEVKSAKDGYSAGWLLGSFKPEIVILDLMMPGINGFKICQEIRNSEELQDTKVIVLTGFANKSNFEKAIECGATVCLSKPIELDALKDTVLKFTENIEST